MNKKIISVTMLSLIWTVKMITFNRGPQGSEPLRTRKACKCSARLQIIWRSLARSTKRLNITSQPLFKQQEVRWIRRKLVKSNETLAFGDKIKP